MGRCRKVRTIDRASLRETHSAHACVMRVPLCCERVRVRVCACARVGRLSRRLTATVRWCAHRTI